MSQHDTNNRFLHSSIMNIEFITKEATKLGETDFGSEKRVKRILIQPILETLSKSILAF